MILVTLGAQCLVLHITNTLLSIKAISLNSESFSCNGGERPMHGRKAASSWTEGRSQGDPISVRVECSPLSSKLCGTLSDSCPQKFVCRCSPTWASTGLPSLSSWGTSMFWEGRRRKVAGRRERLPHGPHELAGQALR